MIKNLRNLRNQQNISQQALANILGISQQAINKYENHSIEPDISTLIAMANYFGVSIDYLVGRVSEPDDTTVTCSLSKKENKLITDYRSLSLAERTCIDTLIRTYKDMK